MLSKAEEYYLGEGGTAYLARNQPRLLGERNHRAAVLRGVVPAAVSWKRWLEVGAGLGTNLLRGDVAVDIDPRVVREMAAHEHSPLGVVGRAQSLPFLVDRSFAVVCCVGLLMHLPDGEWQQAVAEMARVSRQYLILGEYVQEAAVEKDLEWQGEKGLVWKRWYPPVVGWTEVSRVCPLLPFDSDVTFLVWERQ